MNMPYQPPRSLSAKIARKLLPYRERRDLKFNLKQSIVSFTFDDFPLSAIDNGSKYLEREGWKSTFYVAAGLEGVTNHHGENFAASDLSALQAAGHEIAGHTFGHVDCAHLSIDEVLAEIRRNQTALKAMGISGEIEHFAYPFGAANAAIKYALSKKFKSLRGISPGVHKDKVDLNQLKATPVFSGKKFSQAMDLIRDLKTEPSWLVLFTHDIRENPSKWGCTPDEFKILIHAVRKSGAKVLPVGEAIKTLEAGNG